MSSGLSSYDSIASKTKKHMAAKKVSKKDYLITPNSWGEYNELFECATEISTQHGIAFVWVPGNETYGVFWGKLSRNPLAKPEVTKVVILWAGRPVDPIAILSWRSGLIEEGDLAYRFVMIPDDLPGEGWKNWLKEQTADWARPAPEREQSGLRLGEFVKYGNKNTGHESAGYDPAFLTISPTGKMVPILDRLDACKRLFRQVIGSRVGARRDEVLKVANELFAFNPIDPKYKNKNIAQEITRISDAISELIKKHEFNIDRNQLPRILLLGPSGVGKTLIARYLAWRTSSGQGEPKSRPFKRIPIPEYLHKEDFFEYDVFGYTQGAYTGAREGGNKGFLVERMGGVVFFDEIGEASPAIQAKMLAYLDDYQVTPRGWEGKSIFCPVLVIAATNRPIDKWADEDESGNKDNNFRNDLFRRFNVIIHIPSLDERKDELPFILDAMLQTEAFNPGNKIKEIGEQALKVFQDIDYKKGNFRTLENSAREACRRAAIDGRDYIVSSDVIYEK